MPNLFSKIASQNGILKLFAGRQIKSLVPLIDVARCLNLWKKIINLILKFLTLLKRL